MAYLKGCNPLTYIPQFQAVTVSELLFALTCPNASMYKRSPVPKPTELRFTDGIVTAPYEPFPVMLEDSVDCPIAVYA